MAKINGVAQAVTTYSTNTPAQATDGSTSTRWESDSIGAATLNDHLAITFSTPVKMRRLNLLFHTWSRDLQIGYADTYSTNKADYTVLRSCNLATETDDAGKPWWMQESNGADINVGNTLIFPTNEISAKVWVIFSNSIARITTGNIDRMRVHEMSIYDTVNYEGTNPKPVASVPVLPFSATPANWVRTEFAVSGTFDFIPASDTTMLLVIAQGAGAGGRVNATLAGEATPAGTSGGDTTVATSNGTILIGPGGKTNVLADAMFAGRTFDNWTRFVDGAYARAGAVGSTTAGPAGAQSYLAGTVGAAFTLAAQQTNLPAETASNAFTGPTVSTKLTWAFTGNGTRQNSTGLSISTNGDTITLPFKAVEGQTITLNFAATSGLKPYTIYLNGEVVDSGTMSTNGPSRVINVTQTGEQTLVIAMTGTSSGTIGLASLVFSSFGVSSSRSGASGRTAIAYMLPKPLTLNVGAGGLGQSGGQNVTAAQNGVRGSGGGVGGNGGDGVIVVYELKVAPIYEDSAPPTFASYNTAQEASGAYRTDYTGVVSTEGQQTFQHKLRERTRAVLVIMVGAGGGKDTGPAQQQPPTTLASGSKLYTATSGQGGASITGGGGGTFSPDDENVLLSANGIGGSYGYDNTASSPVNGGWGTGSGSAAYRWGGGAGGYGFILLGAKDLTSRVLDIQVANLAAVTGVERPGAVMVMETETEFGPYITQLTELVLAKQVVSRTQVTQASELVFAKENVARTQITQTPELILAKETDAANNLQVSHATIAFVVDAEDPSTLTSQSTELVFAKQSVASSQVSQTTELILAKQPFSLYRTSQVAEMLFLSETPTVFWLNFGTIDDPMKNQLYTSLTGRASSVKDGAYIQLESEHAPGTTLFINDVDVGLAGSVKNNDRVYIRGGIPNWWQTSINVYTYYITNGEVTRELVGTWTFNHPIRVPAISRAYAEMAIQTNWLKLAANIVRGSVLSAVWAKTNVAVATLTSMFSSALASSFANVGVVFAQANAKYATAALGWELTKAKVADAINTGYEAVVVHAELANEQTFDVSKTHGNNEPYVFVVEKADAISHTTRMDDFGIVAIGASDAALFGFTESHVGAESYENTEFDLIKAASGESVPLLTSDYTVGYGGVKVEMEKWKVDHQETAESEFLPIVYTHYFGIFKVEAIPTIAYTSFVDVSYEFQKIYGTSSYRMPTGDADVQKTGFGTFAYDTAWTIAYSTPTDRDVIKSGAAERGYFDTAAIFTSAAYGQSGYEWVREVKGIQTFELNSVFVQKGMQKTDLIPYVYKQMENGRGKASLYLGFDTLNDAQTFTQNYSDVTITPRFNGFTYTVGVDKTFVCEIYFNGPVSGLIQGG